MDEANSLDKLDADLNEQLKALYRQRNSYDPLYSGRAPSPQEELRRMERVREIDVKQRELVRRLQWVQDKKSRSGR
jgi:hypothetical protein